MSSVEKQQQQETLTIHAVKSPAQNKRGGEGSLYNLQAGPKKGLEVCSRTCTGVWKTGGGGDPIKSEGRGKEKKPPMFSFKGELSVDLKAQNRLGRGI